MTLFISGFLTGQIVMGLLMLHWQKQRYKRLMNTLEHIKKELKK